MQLTISTTLQNEQLFFRTGQGSCNVNQPATRIQNKGVVQASCHWKRHHTGNIQSSCLLLVSEFASNWNSERKSVQRRYLVIQSLAKSEPSKKYISHSVDVLFRDHSIQKCGTLWAKKVETGRRSQRLSGCEPDSDHLIYRQIASILPKCTFELSWCPCKLNHFPHNQNRCQSLCCSHYFNSSLVTSNHAPLVSMLLIPVALCCNFSNHY